MEIWVSIMVYLNCRVSHLAVTKGEKVYLDVRQVVDRPPTSSNPCEFTHDGLEVELQCAGHIPVFRL